MNILGLSAVYHDSAACLVQDGQIVAVAQEERFTRKKHDASFPRGAVEYCLKEGGIGPEQLDAVAFYEKPVLKFERGLFRAHQTVDRERFPRFHRLLEAFYEQTGGPLLINTSFNVRGEPIVEAPTRQDVTRLFDVDLNPTPRKLREFGLVAFVAFGLLSVMSESLRPLHWCWCCGCAGGTRCAAARKARATRIGSKARPARSVRDYFRQF